MQMAWSLRGGGGAASTEAVLITDTWEGLSGSTTLVGAAVRALT